MICNHKKWGSKFRKPCVIVSWNLKFQESIEWKSEVRSDDEYYDEEDESIESLSAYESVDGVPWYLYDGEADA